MKVSALFSRHLRGSWSADEAMAARTSIRTGGRADFLVQPADPEDLQELLRLCAGEGLPLSVMGGGANSIVSDEGIEGVVLRLPPWGEEAAFDEEGATFTLGAGTPIAKVGQLMRRHGLGGGEFLAGIPGTLGGAAAMNAGTRHGETVRIVEALELVDAESRRWFPAGELRWRYRCCELPQGAVISRLRIRLQRLDEGGLAASKDFIAGDLAYRKGSQPLHLPNSGSVFTNPRGDHAARLIEAAGLKGVEAGAARISEKHANFIVNPGGARSAEVRSLIELARETVARRFGVELEAEVKLVGRWQGWQS